MPQVEPDRTYDQDIFEKFLDLTNIKDPKARLLTKVWITIIVNSGHSSCHQYNTW